MELIDYTADLITNSSKYTPFSPDTPDITSGIDAPVITASMLNSRPEIKTVLLDALDEFIVKWADLQAVTGGETSGEVVEGVEGVFTDDQILNAINSDAYVQGTVFECLNELTDTIEGEGVANYYPSIFDSDNWNTLSQYLKTGVREDQAIEDLPAKYAHLDADTVDLIYTHPQCRKILGQTEAAITPELVRELCFGN